MDDSSHKYNETTVLEVSGDSEDSAATTPSAGPEEEEDDAESCINGGDDDCGCRDERWISWRSWCEESAIEYQAVEMDGRDAPREGELMAEMEGNRLFWEACLANEYSTHM